MTEVPDYLLERSRQRREALGLPGGEAPAGAAPSAAAAPPSGDAPSAPAPAPVSAGTAPAPVSAGVGMPSAAAAAAGAPVPTSLPADHVRTGPRSGIPVWMMPVLLVLPFWGVIYLGAFAQPKAAAGGPPNGAAVYVKAGCGGCHGPTGGGGVGPKLAGGEAKLTFPDEADHIAWVEGGSAPSKGKSYGDPNRPGGARPPASGGMPAFKAQLSPAEIQAVVQYERDRL